MAFDHGAREGYTCVSLLTQRYSLVVLVRLGPMQGMRVFKYSRRLTVCDAHHGQSHLVLQGFMLLVIDRKQIFITAVCFYRQKKFRVQSFVEFLLQEAH